MAKYMLSWRKKDDNYLQRGRDVKPRERPWGVYVYNEDINRRLSTKCSFSYYTLSRVSVKTLSNTIASIKPG